MCHCVALFETNFSTVKAFDHNSSKELTERNSLMIDVKDWQLSCLSVSQSH